MLGYVLVCGNLAVIVLWITKFCILITVDLNVEECEERSFLCVIYLTVVLKISYVYEFKIFLIIV